MKVLLDNINKINEINIKNPKTEYMMDFGGTAVLINFGLN